MARQVGFTLGVAILIAVLGAPIRRLGRPMLPARLGGDRRDPLLAAASAGWLAWRPARAPAPTSAALAD